MGGDNIGMTTGIDYRFGDHLAVGSSLGYASFGVGTDPRGEAFSTSNRGASRCSAPITVRTRCTSTDSSRTAARRTILRGASTPARKESVPAVATKAPPPAVSCPAR